MRDPHVGDVWDVVTEPLPTVDAQGTTPGRLRSMLRGWRDPQHRDGLALVLSSAISSIVGLLYWVVAARLFPPDEVGVNTTLISTMTLLGVTAQLNLGSALLRFVPVAGRSARSLVAGCYATTIVTACVLGAGFALGARWWAPDLVGALGPGPLLVFFVLATPVWAVFAMHDYTLTAIKRAPLVPLENLAFSLLKVAFLVVGTVLVFRGVIAVSWVVATAVVVLVVAAYLTRVLRPTAVAAPSRVRIGPRSIAGYVSADWAGGLCTDAVEFGLPLVVLYALDPDSAATFSVVWAIAYAFYLVTHGMSQSMVTHVASSPETCHTAVRTMVTKALTLIVPGVLVVVLGAGLILSIFGPHYAESGTTLLVLCALSAVPNVVVGAAVAVARIRQRPSAIFGVPATVAVIVVPLALALMPHRGLTGVGIALVVGQSVVAAGILLNRWARA
ncbi:lipopolysaccharide biosynthesis protein [Pseudonocardia sp. DLS-67]